MSGSTDFPKDALQIPEFIKSPEFLHHLSGFIKSFDQVDSTISPPMTQTSENCINLEPTFDEAAPEDKLLESAGTPKLSSQKLSIEYQDEDCQKLDKGANKVEWEPSNTSLKEYRVAKSKEQYARDKQKVKDAKEKNIFLTTQIEAHQNETAIKERNANFAVYLRRETGEQGILEKKEEYERMKLELYEKHDELIAVDKNIKTSYGQYNRVKARYEHHVVTQQGMENVKAKDRGNKYSTKKRMKGKKEICEKFENEHKLRREIELSKLADEYLRCTVPGAVPLVNPIPTNVLCSIITSHHVDEFQEFHKYVTENMHQFAN